MTKRKSGSFTAQGIESLAKNKPVVYEIQNQKGDPNYIGVAKRGRVEQRLKEHLLGGKDPIRGGKTVKIIQKSSIQEALKTEARMIKSKQPPQNKRGK